MIGADILQNAYRLTNKNVNTFLDGNTTNIYADLNSLYGQRVLDILQMRTDKNATIQNSTTDLISTVGLTEGDPGFNGEYPFPTDLLRPSRIEVSYDGKTWIKAEIYDNALNDRSEYNDEQLAQDFSQSTPRVDFTRNSYKIRPPKTTAGNITNGIYIEYEKRQEDFTENTEPTEIEQNLQNILAYDLANLEMIMHTEKYTTKKINIFNIKRKEVEDKFLIHYKRRLTGKKQMTFNHLSYK